MTDRNELLDTVDLLTKPRHDHIAQIDDDGTWLKAHTTEYPPLLVQLKQAVNPSTNTSVGSSSLASTRNLIDSDALFEYGKISSAIGDWCRIYQVQTTRDPIVDLRRWYVAFIGNPSDSGWHLRELKRWAGVVMNILEPPKKFDLVVPCPVCGQDEYPNQDGDMLAHPLVGTYRLDTAGTVVSPKVICRAVRTDDSGLQTPCGAEWDSFDAMEELGQELAERHADQNRTTTM